MNIIAVDDEKIVITWSGGDEMDIDRYELYRSTSRYSWYTREALFETDDESRDIFINNTNLKKGVTYYYKVVGYTVINGEKVYTERSLKAFREI